MFLNFVRRLYYFLYINSGCIWECRCRCNNRFEAKTKSFVELIGTRCGYLCLRCAVSDGMMYGRQAGAGGGGRGRAAPDIACKCAAIRHRGDVCHRSPDYGFHKNLCEMTRNDQIILFNTVLGVVSL